MKISVFFKVICFINLRFLIHPSKRDSFGMTTIYFHKNVEQRQFALANCLCSTLVTCNPLSFRALARNLHLWYF
jgi:hypothetical protein